MAEIPIERKPRRSFGPLLLILILILLVVAGWYWWMNNGNKTATGHSNYEHRLADANGRAFSVPTQSFLDFPGDLNGKRL